MNILFYSHFYYPEVGAASLRAQYFVKILKEAGHDINIIAPVPNYPHNYVLDGYKPHQVDKERNIVYLPIFVPKKHSVIGRIYSYISYFFSSLYHALFKASKPEVIISSSPPIFTPFAAALVSRLRGTKFIFDIRDIWPDIGVELGIVHNKLLVSLLRGIEKFILKTADFITVTAESEKINLIKKGVNADKIVVIYNGADTEVFKPIDINKKLELRDKYKIPRHKKVLIYFGSFNNGMNDIDTLGDALSQLKELNGSVHFIAVGDGSNRVNFFNKLNGKIEYSYFKTMNNEEVANLVSLSDLSIIPRKLLKHETGGNIPVKCFESWGAEIPVIISSMQTSEITAIFKECEAGLLVEPNNSIVLRDGIIELLTDNNLKELGKKGKDIVDKKYDRKEQAKKLISILTKLAQK